MRRSNPVTSISRLDCFAEFTIGRAFADPVARNDVVTARSARYASQSTISANAAGAACTNRILRLTVAAP